MLELLTPGMVEEIEDERGRRLIERFKEYMKKVRNIQEIVKNENILDIMLRIRFLVLLEMEKQKEEIDLERMVKDFYDTMKDKKEFIDLLPYFENYIFPIVKVSSDILKFSGYMGQEGQSGKMGIEESVKYFGGVENITYRRYIEFLYSIPLKLICLFRREFCEILNEIITLSLITDALIFIFILKDDIDEEMFLDAKEMFKFVVQLYFIDMEIFLKMVSEPNKGEIKLNWRWEGAIKDNRPAVDIQHDILNWRIEN